jgi:5S rRNA maturation endonuclease (ribonuclease M5)
MSVDKKREFIVGELNILGRKEIDRFGAKIVCPFHSDTNPSMNVNLDLEEKSAPLGWARCWSCKTSVPWDTLADKLGFRKYTNTKKEAEDYVDPARYREGLLSNNDDENDEDGGQAAFKRELDDLQFFEFQQEEWRDLPTDLLTKVGCKFCYKEYNDSFYIWMPVYVNKELRGYVKAELEKPEPVVKRDKKGKEYLETPPSYINASGKWSKIYGLLFYDYAVRLMRRKGLKTLILCEGPRDALRLLRYGIPAIAVLGAGNWNEQKRFQLEKTGAENIIIFMDGDEAGKAATKSIYKDIKNYFSTRYVSLWKHSKDLDPFNCPKKFLIQVKRSLI